MPWKETRVLDERLRLVLAYLNEKASLADLCRRFGVSRKTGRKWVGRYRELGPEGVRDRSRAPLHHPNATPPEVVALVIRTKLEHPTWGPRKVVAWLEMKQPGFAAPAASTVGGILHRSGLVRPRRRVRRTDPWTRPFAHCTGPNQTWCADFKGWFRTGDGERCDPLTISDACTRQMLCCQEVKRPGCLEVRAVMEHVFVENGLPAVIRTDNGVPFASTGVGGLSRLSVWWIKLGIMPERIAPGHPEQNGRHERLHATLKAETLNPPKANRREQQKAFDAFRREYNEERPHEALGQRPPASVYRPSHRSYPGREPEVWYPAELTVRRVRTNGQIKWKGSMVYLSEALTGEPVGLRQESERHWAAYFGPLKICLLDDVTRQVVRIAPAWQPEVVPMCPV